jgi:hypothetical protein
VRPPSFQSLSTRRRKFSEEFCSVFAPRSLWRESKREHICYAYRVSVVRKKKTVWWEVIGIRAKGQYLGRVKGGDRESARRAAARQFELRDGEERWLMIRPA